MTSDRFDAAERERLLRLFNTNRSLAHQTLFRHRHPDRTPRFHDDIIEAWHDPLLMRLLVMAFREGGKSTIAEEGTTLMASMRSFRNCVILGENQERAIDRLTAIKHELSTNEFLINLFGELKDNTKWNEAKIILTNGVILQALGRGQEVRGMKHLDIRPDFCLVDDVEGKEHVKDEHARKETLRWFFAEVLPALDKSARVRVIATPLDSASLPMKLIELPGWRNQRYPIKYRGEDGAWRPTWGDRYSLTWIDAKEEEMRRLGLHHEFMREYMCEPDDPTKKLFTAGMFRVEPKLHVWQPTFAFYDPARTARADSHSTTGWAVWSWLGNRLTVWDAGAGRWLPDALINHMFEINSVYHPVQVGVEEDGLEEFVKQPLRAEIVRRGVLLPVEPRRAPKGKLDFIGSMQPFFAAGEVTLAKELPDLVAQFLNYPTGLIDAPNALAYALLMRPGLAMYEDFVAAHVVESCPVFENAPCWLAVNATMGVTTAVLVQFVMGSLRVCMDWVREGDPGAVLSDIVKAARLEVAKDVRIIIPRQHFYEYDTVGLRAAVKKLPAELRQGGVAVDGRTEIRSLLKLQVRGVPAVQIAHAAHWTINAFASGYARAVNKGGQIREEATPGMYRTLMEGLESSAALMQGGLDEADKAHYAYTAGGLRYKTILPGRQEHADEKSAWIGVSDPYSALRQK